MLIIDVEEPADRPAIDALLDRVFGADRHGKASYQFRADVPHVAGLSWVARCRGRLVGTIRYWPVQIGSQPARLLGPLGVDPDLRGRGIGRTLVRLSLGPAATVPVLLVGDASYYRPLGFVPAAARVTMPHEQPERLMVLGSLDAVPTGVLRPAAGDRAGAGAAIATATP